MPNNEEILEKLKTMSVREAIAYIDSLEEQESKSFSGEPEELESEHLEFVDFKALPKYDDKGKHPRPFYCEGRW